MHARAAALLGMALALAHIAEGFVGKRAVVSRSFAINELTTRRFAGDESPHGDPSVALPTARAIEALISPEEFSPSDWLCFQEPVLYRDPAVALGDAETLPARKTTDTRPKFAPMRWLRVALGRSGTLRPVDAESLPRAPPGARASHDNGADPLHLITFEDYWNGRAGMVQQMILSAQHDADEDEVQ